MNKQEINEIVDMFALTSESAKSCANRLESALGKTGSASSRLSMAGSSLLSLADKSSNEDDQATLTAIGAFTKFLALVAVDNKKQAQADEAPAKPKKARKTGWENLKPADAPAKPKKTKNTYAQLVDADADGHGDILETLMNMIAERQGR
jgi:hypothetical protein